MSKERLRVNERILAKAMRVIDENGKQVGILKRDEALAMAKAANLDLVEVASEVDPPVCRIINYGKFKYKQKKKLHQKQHSSHLKEVRLRPKIGEHDLQTKINQARKFIAKNDRVVVNMIFKGREAAHINIVEVVMKKFIDAMEGVAKIEKKTGMEGKKMGIIFSPK